MATSLLNGDVRLIAEFSSDEVRAMKPGVTIKALQKESIILYKSADDDDRTYKSKATLARFRACRNVCYHQEGTFVIRDVENPIPGECSRAIVSCTKHNWKLDVSTMEYINPPEVFDQDELIVQQKGDGRLAVYEVTPPVQPWEIDARLRKNLEPNEVTVTYYTHACVEMKFKDVSLFTDPWLTGPAFARGWWLLHEPPPNWLDKLSAGDLIYISHLHSDHLSYPTMKLIAERNPDIPIVVGKLVMPVFSRQKHYGVQLNNITVLELGTWHEVNEDLRLMILPDGVHTEMDTCLLIDYKGHLIFNAVDCSKPNFGHMPKNVDLMMGDFAGGATSYPVCFSGGRFSEEFKTDFIKMERKKILNYRVAMAKKIKPRLYLPFAGYFTEAHPSDKYIRSLNLKNDPSVVNSLIEKYCGEYIKTWTPKPGECVDLHTLQITPAPFGSKVVVDDWDFDKYTKWIDRSIDFAPFQYDDSLRFYFDWTGFNGYNLVLKLIEAGEHFETIANGRTFLVDFLDLSYPQERPCREHYFLEMKVRIGVFREIMKFGYLWDNLTYGFQCRLYREPDAYHFKFWTHMQNLLPESPPDWSSFLESKCWSKEKIEWAMSEAQTPQYMLPE
eukprot:m.211034 g.211034  ORF g.211034 m.211034 type:complete len:614 (+) comp39749_c1_seq1:42-1883(+)